MTSHELRKLFTDFFIRHGHAHIPSAPTVPENDPTVLFTTAGMHPLVPYLMGRPHPMGKRLVSIQKCVRTNDIDDVGDDTHLTLFEMMGNWSLGDYFKKESIAMSYEFLTKDLAIPHERLTVTCFEGDVNAPRDSEAADIWKTHGFTDDRISFLPAEDNWWGPAGQTGPCGPDTEIFYIRDDGKEVEIWNNVFMQYNKTADGKYELSSQQNVDTGMGLERTLCLITGKNNVYETELFTPLLDKITELTGHIYNGMAQVPFAGEGVAEGRGSGNTKAFRIISDHIRASTFLIADGVLPSNTDRGYILRRLIRRAYRYLIALDALKYAMSEIAKVVIENYKDPYSELGTKADEIVAALNREEDLFSRTLENGLKMAKKFIDANDLTPVNVFHLYATYGFPFEFTTELATEHGLTTDKAEFDKLFSAHQAESRAGAEQKFKGGLADNSTETTRLHTAAHLAHAALRKVLGDNVYQRGANITAERLRFDFSFDRKMTPEEIAEVEKLVNEAIDAKLPMNKSEMSVDAAHAAGAIGIFDDKYESLVSVYEVPGVSKEICGGPHVENTGELGKFKIQKEESSAAGIRRIKAVLE